ncbi:putative MFS multidrug transporter [Bisporella sp. PMI_857]|nr:putative MFS multidrug transporter [Bisporella sp. PMI_857]
MIGLELAVLCVALDNTIIATAIPKISDEFEALSDVGWYGSAYLLTISASQLFFGRLYGIFNVKWTFLCSLIIFEVGSLVCGVAPSSTALIIGRAIAGLGASGLFSGTFIIIAVTTPLEKRPVYISLVSAVYAIASVVGPLLGGVFTDYATWRWCFYINLPFGCITIVAIVFFLHLKPADSQPERSWRKTITQFDPLGTFLFMPCIICLLLALQWGGTKHAWDSAQIIALFVVFGVLLIAFAAVQVWVGDNATIPVRIARQRSLAFSSLFEFCLSASFFIMVYYTPIWFQAIRDESATRSGINTLPLTMSVVVGTIVGGIGTTIFGFYVPFMYASVVLGAIGAGLIYTWTVDISTGKAIGYQLLFGIGIGVGIQQPIVAAQTVLSAADVPTGTAIIIFAQHFGGVLLVSAAQNTFINRLVSRIKDLPGINPTQVVNAGATQITSLTKDSTLLHAIKVAYNDGLTQTYLVSLTMVCLAIIGNVGVEWRSPVVVVAVSLWLLELL